MHLRPGVEPETDGDFTTRVLVLYGDEAGKPQWLRDLTFVLDRFGLEVGTRPMSAVRSVPSLLRGHRFCVFILVETPQVGPDVCLQWQRHFHQLAASTQLLRVVDEHAAADVIADAVLSDVERIASRLRRQRANTVTPGIAGPTRPTTPVGHDLEE